MSRPPVKQHKFVDRSSLSCPLSPPPPPPNPPPQCRLLQHALVTKLSCDADFLSAALSKYSAELQRSHKTVLKRRSRGRYLQLFACADGTGPSQVGICSARDEGQARMRKSPCEGCFVVHRCPHRICDANRSPSSDPLRPIQCSASDGSKILCEQCLSDDSCLKNPSRKSILFNMK